MAPPVPIDDSRPIRWGIAATGRIATDFTRGLAQVPDAEVIAVASRTQEGADRFAFEHAIPHRHGSYEAMANDPDVDVVYVGTPHSRHCDDTLLYLNAGKHVLCEKPFAINEEQATRMADAARRNERFLMEAIWSRFLPAYVQLRKLVSDGRIGEIRMVEASFGFRAPFVADASPVRARARRRRAPRRRPLPGAARAHVVRRARHVTATAEIGETGVDEQIAVVMAYADGPLAVAMAAIRTDLPSTGAHQRQRWRHRRARADAPPRLPRGPRHAGHESNASTRRRTATACTTRPRRSTAACAPASSRAR